MDLWAELGSHYSTTAGRNLLQMFQLPKQAIFAYQMVIFAE
jgi:hypothetical protein